MKEFRPLTSEEINVLESHGCWAEDWSSVMVDEGFMPNYLSRVLFYGENLIFSFLGKRDAEVVTDYFSFIFNNVIKQNIKQV